MVRSAVAVLPPDIKSASQILANLEEPDGGRGRSLFQRCRRFAEMDAGISGMVGLGYSAGLALGFAPLEATGLACITMRVLHGHRYNYPPSMLERACDVSLHTFWNMCFAYWVDQLRGGPSFVSAGVAGFFTAIWLYNEDSLMLLSRELEQKKISDQSSATNWSLLLRGRLYTGTAAGLASGYAAQLGSGVLGVIGAAIAGWLGGTLVFTARETIRDRHQLRRKQKANKAALAEVITFLKNRDAVEAFLDIHPDLRQRFLLNHQTAEGIQKNFL